MKLFYWLLLAAAATALLSWLAIGQPMLTFFSAGVALVCLSKVLGDGAEQLSRYVGQAWAGTVQVTLSNTAELMIIYSSVQAGLLDLVKAGIVGSMVGNLLFVAGLSVYLGCRRHGTMPLHEDTATLYINQLLLVSFTLALPTLFAKWGNVTPAQELPFSYLLSAMLLGVYVYYSVLRQRDPRFKRVEEQHDSLNHRWSLWRALATMVLGGAAAVLFSHLLIGQVEAAAERMHLSLAFVGFIMLPFFGNVAEQLVAVFAARRGMVELSLSISLGSASQVGMVIAPLAVLFGYLNGTPVTLELPLLAIATLGMTVTMVFVVLRDNKWNINEGVMLLAFYFAIIAAYWFAQ